MVGLHRWLSAFKSLRSELALLRGWSVTCEHELVILERMFYKLFPSNTVPYLDFLRRENIGCNPYTLYTAISSHLQESKQHSALFDLAMSGALEQIGRQYHDNICIDQVSQLFTEADICDIVNSHFTQCLDLAENPARYGSPLEAEAAFVVSEKLFQKAAPEFASKCRLNWEAYAEAAVGDKRLTRHFYEAGMKTEQIEVQFIDHWQIYLDRTEIQSVARNPYIQG